MEKIMFEFLLASGGMLPRFRPGAIIVEYAYKMPIFFRPGAVIVEYAYTKPTQFRLGAICVEYAYRTV